MAAHGIGADANVYAELGSTWFLVARRPEEAAHVLGKLLLAVGPERILWGTDSVWYGSPQPQIMAFRAFQITPEFQARYRYPALTDAVKTGQRTKLAYALDNPGLSRIFTNEILGGEIAMLFAILDSSRAVLRTGKPNGITI